MNLRKVFILESKWTQGCAARDGNGKPLDLTFINRDIPKQVKLLESFSLQGAVAWYFPFETRTEERYRILDKLRNAVRKYTGKDVYVAEFNDDPKTTFEDIQKVLKIAEKS